MGADTESGGRPLDPSEALTAPEAARRAGVPVAEIRRAMDGGRLLFETGRRRGKDVRLVRFMDLALLYPRLRGAPPPPPEAPVPDSGPEPEPEPEPAALPNAFEVRLAAMQASNAGLSQQLVDMRDVREDLRAQCGDMRVRLSALEKERQATTAGLLMAQRRILELEAGPAAPSPAWRRTAMWGLAIVSVAASLMWRDAVRTGSALAGDIDKLTSEVGAGDEALASALSEAETARLEFARQLERIEERSQATLAELDSERSAAQEQRRLLDTRIAEERGRADDLDERLRVELEQAEARWDEVQKSLGEARAEASRASAEGEAALTAALAALAAERAVSRSERERAAELREGGEEAVLAERRATQERMDRLLAELRETRAATAKLLEQRAAAPAPQEAREVLSTPGGVRPKTLMGKAYAALRAWVSARNGDH